MLAPLHSCTFGRLLGEESHTSLLPGREPDRSDYPSRRVDPCNTRRPAECYFSWNTMRSWPFPAPTSTNIGVWADAPSTKRSCTGNQSIHRLLDPMRLPIARSKSAKTCGMELMSSNLDIFASNANCIRPAWGPAGHFGLYLKKSTLEPFAPLAKSSLRYLYYYLLIQRKCGQTHIIL